MARGARARWWSEHYWTVVERGLHCWKGNHQTEPGKWMRFRKKDPFKRGSCEDCLRLDGIERPTRKVTMNVDGVDVKARQVGDE